MKRFAFMFVALLCLASCVEDDFVISSDENVEAECKRPIFEPEPVRRSVKISATSTGDAVTRTSLSGQSVLWKDGDKIRVISEQTTGTSDVLRVIVDAPGQALGIETTPYITVKIKYSGINVRIGGEDVTDQIVSTSSDSNSEKIGITNSKSNYQFPPVNTEIDAKVYNKNIFSNHTIPFVRSSSSSSFSKGNIAVVTFTGIETKKPALSWKKITEEKTLRNGGDWNNSDIKDVAAYAWLHGYDAELTLSDGAGETYGEFEGKATLDDVDDKTRAVFPYDAVKSYTSGKLTLSVPATQTYAENSFDSKANIMIGKPEVNGDGSYYVPFKNMCGVLRLLLKGNGEISTLKVTDKSGKQLNGTATIDVNKLEDGQGITNDMLSGGSSSITLNCSGVVLSSEKATEFNIVVPAGSFADGLEIEATSPSGQIFRKSASGNNMISCNEIKKMPELTAELYNVYDLENEAVKKYFSYTPYKTYGEKSHFTTYASALKNYFSHDTPNKVPLSWSGDASTTYTLTLTHKNDDGVNVTKAYTVTGNRYDVDNLVPGKKYSYTVKDGDNVVSSSAFYTSGQVRMGRIDDSWNCRDLGGWSGLNGKKIKYEWIYRCSSLNGEFYKKPSSTNYVISECANPNNYSFHEASIQQILELGFKSELDLRTTEVEENNPNAKGLSHSWALDQNNTGIEDWNYFHIKTSGATAPLSDYSIIKDVAWIINEVINKKRPVAFHCRSGADRTGMLAIALESLLGVAPGDLARDYELTNFSSEQPKAEGKNELRDRKVTDQRECYKFHKAIFQDDKNNPGTNYQEKMYYYLNQKFANIGVAISASDLDNFIKFMLGIDSYTHPSWATNNDNSLEYIFNHH